VQTEKRTPLPKMSPLLNDVLIGLLPSDGLDIVDAGACFCVLWRCVYHLLPSNGLTLLGLLFWISTNMSQYVTAPNIEFAWYWLGIF
jgi:hypothetical protein